MVFSDVTLAWGDDSDNIDVEVQDLIANSVGMAFKRIKGGHTRAM